ncbi:MAG: fumarylacetoacetate hydrolase family protein, partial [Candidatus Marinimicrobia bacterium]|nr:fumarylacetoacetate hydrolase family protein [Candidatus Neomarinimicrobiota bacterium]
MNHIILKNKRITPSKIVCVGMNYAEHIQELDSKKPSGIVIFNKPNSAISDDLFFINDKVRFESEISFLINDEKISGVGFGLDLTKADEQIRLKNNGHPWERSKAFDKSAVFSEFVKFSGDITKLKLELYINDK